MLVHLDYVCDDGFCQNFSVVMIFTATKITIEIEHRTSVKNSMSHYCRIKAFLQNDNDKGLWLV